MTELAHFAHSLIIHSFDGSAQSAYLSLDTLDDALVAVEERARDPYDTTLNDELDDLSEQVKELASLCRATGAKDCRTLQDSLQEVRKHVLVLNKARGKIDPKCKSPDAGTTISPSAPVSSKLKAKLPQLELPSFDGDPLNWCVFWERFNFIIRKETGLSNTDRLAYLRSALKTKDGQDIMDGETDSGDDYDELVVNLKQRFDLKRYVHKNHLCLLMNNKISSYSFEEMLRTQMLWKKHLVGLQMSTQFDSEFLLTSIAELSMDEETQKEWALYTHEHKQVPNFKTFLAFLDRAVGALPSKSSKGRASLQAHKKTSFKAITHIARGKSTCQICEGEAHPAYFCPAFKGLTTDKRFSTAQKLKLCHNCLGTDNLTRTCRSSRTCKRCNKRHHTLLHREEVTPSRTTASSVPAETPANPSTSNLVTTQATMAGPVNGKVTTLLMTCELLVDVQGCRQNARALIDTGSSISFITCRLANSLQAKKIPRTTTLWAFKDRKYRVANV